MEHGRYNFEVLLTSKRLDRTLSEILALRTRLLAFSLIAIAGDSPHICCVDTHPTSAVTCQASIEGLSQSNIEDSSNTNATSPSSLET